MHRRTIRRGSLVLLGLVIATAVGTTAAPAVAAPPARHTSVSTAALAAMAQRADPKWYQIQPEFNGEPEFLYAIAARFLGDGERWREIFELNEGRIQPGGGRLTDPAVVTSGWYLILPGDAKGDGVQSGPLPAVPPTAAASSASTTPAGATAAGKPAGSGSSGLVVWIIAGVLVLAGIAAGVWWFLRRRATGRKPAPDRPGTAKLSPGTPSDAPVAAPSRTFDTAAAWTIDRALQVLVTGAGAAGRQTPPVYGVSIDESRLALRLAAPDDEPTEPWEALENGRIWQASLRDLQALPASNDIPSPCPRLVTLGTAGGVRELIDLGQATGMISIQGDKNATRELVASWTEELSSSPWAGGVQVVAGDIRPHLTGGERVTIRDALSLAEGEGSDTAYTLRGGAGTDRTLGVLILGSAPGNRELERAQSLVNRPDAAWVVIVLGQTRYDRWRFTVDADGKVDTGALGLTVYTGSAPARTGR